MSEREIVVDGQRVPIESVIEVGGTMELEVLVCPTMREAILDSYGDGDGYFEYEGRRYFIESLTDYPEGDGWRMFLDAVSLP
jgi:hypothetical protein